MADTTDLTLDSPDLPLADYRALREGRPPAAKIDTSEAKPTAETPAADAESAPDTEPGDTSEEPKQAETDKPKPKRGMVDEIVKLRQKNRELEARLQSSPKPDAAPPPPASPAEAKPAAAPADDKEPDASQFTDYVEWQKAWTRWTIRQDRRAGAAETAKARQQAEALAKARTWSERVVSAKAEKPDYDAVALNADLPVTPVMGDAITDSEIGAEILYHLGQHPAEAARIAKLSPVAQIREIGKIEFQLTKPLVSDDDEGEVPPATIAVSRAPAPVARPTGGTPKPNPIKNIEGMTQAEYRAYRESGKIR